MLKIGPGDLLNKWHLYFLFFLQAPISATKGKSPCFFLINFFFWLFGGETFSVFLIFVSTYWHSTDLGQNIVISMFWAFFFYHTETTFLGRNRRWTDFISCNKYSFQKQMQMEWTAPAICFLYDHPILSHPKTLKTCSVNICVQFCNPKDLKTCVFPQFWIS